MISFFLFLIDLLMQSEMSSINYAQLIAAIEEDRVRAQNNMLFLLMHNHYFYK